MIVYSTKDNSQLKNFKKILQRCGLKARIVVESGSRYRRCLKVNFDVALSTPSICKCNLNPLVIISEFSKFLLNFHRSNINQ